MYRLPWPGMYYKYPPPMLVNCSGCRTPLQIPQGAQSIRCTICKAITNIAVPQSAPPPSQPPAPSSHPPPHSLSSSPSPYNHAPPGAPPHTNGQKRAVICAISYRYSRYELKGSLNDAKCMRYLLINKFKFPKDSILMLTEEETDPYRRPTKHNMRMALYWLVLGCQPGDSLLFHYSGHGLQQRNYNGDEVDGYDETLCPLDFEAHGMIVDDEINATIVRPCKLPLPYGVKLHAIIDACHSGTVLDLPFLCRMNRFGQYVWEDHRPASGLWKGTSGGEVISFSGCKDDQTSADTYALSKIAATGAMTFCFIQAVEKGHGATYGSILTALRNAIQSVRGGGGGVDFGGGGGVDFGGGAVASLVTMLVTGGSVGGFGGRLSQEPQLTACEPFDVYSKPFTL